MTAPLDGCTVVSLEQAVAAPLATRNLADLGARVIKIERRDGGDFARDYDHVVDGTGAHFVWLNRGKESLAVDLKAAEGRTVVRELIDGADVFVQNLAPGAAARLGLDAAALRVGNPRLITVDISGYGTGGPYEQRKAYDMLVQAEAGLISINGTADGYAKTGIPVSDIASGMYCAQSVLAALLRRERTGEGAAVEISMLEATVEWMGHPMYTQMFTGVQPPRLGVSHISIAPYDSYPTTDGEVLIGVQSDRGWRDLVEQVLGAPELADDPRFATNIARVANRAACDAAVAERTAVLTTADLDDRLAAAGVPAGQVKLVGDMVDHPQLTARDRWRSVTIPGGRAPALLPPATFADSPAVMGAVPALGQHTAEILRRAGLPDDRIAELIRSGVVGPAEQ
ncbi:CaiB/BaiF CoA transferase family protein [Gordonia sp. VNK21]|uniref:CaiB/BaiF CoA transferase family protein n=1 Tax=Gordonia sp. VNK21 TaxID=3382483 RepID=UPI0038D47972